MKKISLLLSHTHTDKHGHTYRKHDTSRCTRDTRSDTYDTCTDTCGTKVTKHEKYFLQTTVWYALCLERTVLIAETKESPPTDSLTRLKHDRNNFEYTLLSHLQTFHPLEDIENNSYWTLCNLTQQRWECFSLSITCSMQKFVRVTYLAPTPSTHFPTLPTNSTDMRKLQLWGSAEVRDVLTYSIFPSALQDQRQLWTQKVPNDT